MADVICEHLGSPKNMSNNDPMKDWRGVNSIDTVNIGGEVKDKLKHEQH
jgi:acyl carrier protein